MLLNWRPKIMNDRSRVSIIGYSVFFTENKTGSSKTFARTLRNLIRCENLILQARTIFPDAVSPKDTHSLLKIAVLYFLRNCSV